MSLAADALTASRLVFAIAIGWSISIDRYDRAMLLLIVGWLTDLLDGRLARRARTDTRLGNWDFRIDVSMGVAILVGMVFNGDMSLWVLLVAFGVGVGWTRVTGNPAPAMLMMALVYGWLFGVLLINRPDWWWLPFAATPVLLIIDLRRFFGVILPAFFTGIRHLWRREQTDLPPVLDLWTGRPDEAG